VVHVLPWQQRWPEPPHVSHWFELVLQAPPVPQYRLPLVSQQRSPTPPHATHLPFWTMVKGAVQSTPFGQAFWLSLPQAPPWQPLAEQVPVPCGHALPAETHWLLF
jgi:hypothetical protein